MKTTITSLLALATASLAGCVHGPISSSKEAEAAGRTLVRKVDCGDSPELELFAEHVRQLAEEVYPKMLALLEDGTPRPANQIDIIFKKDLSLRHKAVLKRATQTMPKLADFYAPGVRRGAAIYLDPRLARDPAELDQVLLHELAHVAQNYKWYWNFKTPLYWEEGIADYVAFKMGDQHRDPQCSALWPHYTSGYACAAAFLLYLDQACGAHIVRQLNTALRRGAYSDKFFLEATGKGLDELWIEFLNTPAFTPLAAEMNRIFLALGYAGGKMPKDLTARLEAFIEQQPDGAGINKLVQTASVHGNPAKDIQTRVALYLYFTQPGGAPVAFLLRLMEEGRLPGFRKWEKGLIEEPLQLSETESALYLPVRTVSASKAGDDSTYYYLVERCCGDSGWKLRKAWRTGPGERILEEYSID